MSKEKKVIILLVFFVFLLVFYYYSFHFATSVTFIFTSIGLALICDFVKAYKPKYYKFSLVINSFFLVTIIYALSQEAHMVLSLFYLLPIGLTMLFYGIVNGSLVFIAALLVMLTLGHMDFIYIEHRVEQIIMLALTSIAFSYLILQSRSNGLTNEKWLEKLHVKINELSLLREITYSMQSTTDLKKLNKIILTSLTAGYGLGFNRAAIFLRDGQVLVGESGVGALTKTEAYSIWGRLVSSPSNLNEIIERDEETDETFNDVITKVRIDIYNEKENPLIKCLHEKSPQMLLNNDPNGLGETLAVLNFQNFALAPLISKNQAIGVILVDNRFNEKEITEDDLDSLIALANQSALATENIRLYDRISSLAVTDGLTTVYNHRYFKRNLKNQIEAREDFSLLVIDIDDFKHFNEVYGHSCGDEVLSEVAKALKHEVGKDGSVYRYGGDEFTVILPNFSKEEAIEKAKKIQQRVETVTQQLIQKEVTLSIGISKYPEDGHEESLLFVMADTNLKCSKTSGKNAVT